MTQIKICFVCLGNICRSPTAAGVMRHRLSEAGLDHAVEVDSAGTAGYHIGDLPDERARAEARRRGVDIDDRGRQFGRDDLDRFDLVLAMDDANQDALRRLASTDEHHAKIRLLREFDPEAPAGAPVPDPYYGGDDGFAEVFDLVDAACLGLIDHLRDEHGLA
jgi:protein-tyrosine phosphatase